MSTAETTTRAKYCFSSWPPLWFVALRQSSPGIEPATPQPLAEYLAHAIRRARSAIIGDRLERKAICLHEHGHRAGNVQRLRALVDYDRLFLSRHTLSVLTGETPCRSDPREALGCDRRPKPSQQ